MENNQNNNSNKNNNNRRSGGFFTYLIFFMLLILLAIWVFRFFRKDNSTEITYNEFLQMVEQQKIEKVIIHSETIEIREAGDENNISSLFFGSSKPSLYTGRLRRTIHLLRDSWKKASLLKVRYPLTPCRSGIVSSRTFCL